VHEVYSNYLSQANVLIPRDSKLSTFLAPHVFGSLIKNSAAYSNLFNETGLLVEATNGSYPAILSSFAKNRVRPNGYDLWPTWYGNAQNNLVLKNLLYTQRGQIVWNNLAKYVDAGITETKLAKKYPAFWAKLKSIFSTQAGLNDSDATFKLVVTECIWRVSFYHYQVGNAYPYSFNPDIYHWDFEDDVTISALHAAAVALATSSRQIQLVTLDPIAWFAKGNEGPWQAFVAGLIKDASEHEPESEGNAYIAAVTSDGATTLGRYPAWIWELEPSVGR